MLLAAALLLAQTAPCTTMDATLPAPLSGWTAPGESFAPGKAVTLTATDSAKLGGCPPDRSRATRR